MKTHFFFAEKWKILNEYFVRNWYSLTYLTKYSLTQKYNPGWLYTSNGFSLQRNGPVMRRRQASICLRDKRELDFSFFSHCVLAVGVVGNVFCGLDLSSYSKLDIELAEWQMLWCRRLSSWSKLRVLGWSVGGSAKHLCVLFFFKVNK